MSNYLNRPLRPVPRPIEGTMVPIHLMREAIGRRFAAMCAERGGYWHEWGTGNRAFRREMAAQKRHA